MSAEKGLFPFLTRRKKLCRVSNIGTKKSTISASALKNDGELENHFSDRRERQYPMKREPQSPINILAGYLLCGINPSRERASSRAAQKTSLCGIIKAKRASVSEKEAPLPAARPSTPSERFIALVKNSIHKRDAPPQRNVTGEGAPPRNPTPKNTGTAHAASCPASFWRGERGFTSSKSPTRKITAPPIRKDSLKESAEIFMTDIKRENATKKATPPARGVAFLCILRALGISIAPIHREKRIEKEKSENESKNAAKVSAEFIKIPFDMIITPILDEKSSALIYVRAERICYVNIQLGETKPSFLLTFESVLRA